MIDKIMGADDKARKNGALYDGLHFPTMKRLEKKDSDDIENEAE